MNKNKKFYSQPEAELLVIRFEQNLLTNSVQSSSIQTLSYDDDDALDF